MAETLLAQLRQGASARRSWLLDITTDIGVPCVAAVSCMADGFGFAFGLAARPTLKAAARSAVLEMCQGELAHAVVEAKLPRARRSRAQRTGPYSPAARDDAERRSVPAAAAGQPEPAHHLAIAATDPAAVLRLIVDRLAQLGIEAFGLDLTRPQFGVPVARVIAPGLQALAFGDRHAAVGRYDGANRRGCDLYRRHRPAIDCKTRNPVRKSLDATGCQSSRAGSKRGRNGARKRRASFRLAGRTSLDHVRRPAGRTANPEGRRGSQLSRADGGQTRKPRAAGRLVVEPLGRGKSPRLAAPGRSRIADRVRGCRIWRFLRGPALDPSRPREGRGRRRKHHPPGRERQRASAAAQYACISASGSSKAWTISTRRSGSGCSPSVRPSMTG